MTPLMFGTQIALPVILMIMMFGLGLSLSTADFTRVLRTPRPAVVGILGHAILLPLSAFAILSVFDFPPLVAGGLVILSACPGGVTSNAVVYAGRGDVALAVSLTAISSVVTVFTIPLVVGFGLAQFAGMDASVHLGFLDTVRLL
ncbi:MAG: bile acid:Na+ symporter, BASS family [Alphaproteobacteria bacterium]|nr:bile acid:Na+ symporter, BASS family [Alphaproteobacteria bacterium]